MNTPRDASTLPNEAADEEPQPRRLGDLLVDSGALTDDGLGRALELQKARGGRLGEILLGEDLVRPIELVRALAAQFDLDFIDLEDYDIDWALAELVPESISRRHRLLPLREDSDGRIVVGMVNPADIIALDDARSALRKPIRPVMVDAGQLSDAMGRRLAGDERVQAAIRQAVADAPEVIEEAIQSSGGGAGDAPLIRFVDLMIARAVQDRASDIHVEPSSSALRVRFRIDGVLHEAMHPPRSLLSGIISRIKVMSDLDIAEKRVPQDGRISMMVGDRSIDLRVATVPTVHGESAVLRILRKDDGPARVADLALEPDQLSRLQDAYRRPWGLTLVTGPTGSGKTTTLYSILRELNDPTRNILTVEDPVEYRMDGIKQIQARPKVGLTFASALRSMLRADPDVVLVGEIRDRETAVTAVEASLTGHLVLASIHTNDAVSTPMRLLEMGVEPYLVVAGLRGVLAQRLCRRLCEDCRTNAPMGSQEALAVGIPEWLLLEDGTWPNWASVGCSACSGTGFKGRFAVCEFLEISETVSQSIIERAPSQQVLRTATAEGMITMRQAGLLKAREGWTTLTELYRALG